MQESQIIEATFGACQSWKYCLQPVLGDVAVCVVSANPTFKEDHLRKPERPIIVQHKLNKLKAKT